jgi:hypothetical protein
METRESCFVLAKINHAYGLSLLGRMGRGADAVFVFTFGPFHLTL